ncbi:MAG: cytochrome P450 [Akkermansiaceae bacterium]
MPECPYHDPFKNARSEAPAIATEFDGDPVAMILGFKEVRAAARDFNTYSSDAPFRVPIPREEDVRTVRQYPLEVDPPVHAEYRKIADPFFRRPLQPEMIERMENLIGGLISDAIGRGSIEIVREFAIPLQSRALTYLLNMPESEADLWITWGTHVFRDESGVSKGAEMEAYTNSLFDRALAEPGDDFFSALTQATFEGRPLTREEMQGFANIAFAGGRDTVINTVSTVIDYIAGHPEALDRLRDDPKLVLTATEELFRYASPITHIGRMCPVDTDVHGIKVEAGNLISLCWASANFDETVFENPEEVRLDRKPNPHIAFGNGTHNCLGAAHARLIVRTLLRKLCDLTSGIEKISGHRKLEKEADYERANAFHSLTVRLLAK